MSEWVCALAADTKVETPEGAMTVKAAAGKAIAVFTREGDRVRFRMMRNVCKIAEQQPVLSITLDNGASFRVSPQQILFAKGMRETAARSLQIGDALEPLFHYPQGYEFSDMTEQDSAASVEAWRVIRVEPGGSADLYSIAVNRTGCFFLTAGVLCKAASE